MNPHWFLQNPLMALLILLGILLILYLLFKVLFQFLRLVAIVGLSGIIGTATWVGITLIENALGKDWQHIFVYIFIPQLHREVSITKVFITLFIVFSYLLILMRSPKNSS